MRQNYPTAQKLLSGEHRRSHTISFELLEKLTKRNHFSKQTVKDSSALPVERPLELSFSSPEIENGSRALVENQFNWEKPKRAGAIRSDSLDLEFSYLVLAVAATILVCLSWLIMCAPPSSAQEFSADGSVPTAPSLKLRGVETLNTLQQTLAPPSSDGQPNALMQSVLNGSGRWSGDSGASGMGTSGVGTGGIGSGGFGTNGVGSSGIGTTSGSGGFIPQNSSSQAGYPVGTAPQIPAQVPAQAPPIANPAIPQSIPSQQPVYQTPSAAQPQINQSRSLPSRPQFTPNAGGGSAYPTSNNGIPAASQSPAYQPQQQSPTDPRLATASPSNPPFPPPPAGDDVTGMLAMKEGLVINFPIRNGLDTRWKHIGDYNFIAEINKIDEHGYKFHWHMTPPANASGSRAVDREDILNAYKVSLFYPDNEENTLVGFTSIVRISDALYESLKRGQKTRFGLDGPESPQLLHRNTMPVAHYIYPVGTARIGIAIDGRVRPVTAIHAMTDVGWSYWILDNPRFPVMLQGNGPFQWDALTLAFNPPLFDDGTGSGARNQRARDEARKISDELEKSGTATSYLILFDFDSDNLRPLSKEILTELAQYLRQKPSLRLRVEGHTCTIGGKEYNLNLSERRARSVKRYLVDDCGISATRLVPAGYGFSKPAASNATEKGRRKNRRVVFTELK